MALIAMGCKKAGLLGLFVWLAVWLAVAGISSGVAQPSLLEQLKKGYPEPEPQPPLKKMPPLRLQIASATPAFDSRTSEPVVTFRLNERSGRLFAELTKNNIGRVMELRIDGKVVMRPVIREPILGGSVQVTGGFTAKDAKELADRLNSGAAQVEVEVVE